MSVSQWSTTPANNNSSPPTGAPEGQSPGSLNNVMRQMMADIVTEAQVGAVRVLSGVAGTNTITGSMTPALTAYSAGMLVVFTPANTNTGATTININGLGALDLLKGSEVACVAGDLMAGVPALAVLDAGADDFVLLNPQTVNAVTGTYVGTLTQMTTTVTGTINYSISNGLITLWVNSAITGTSNSNGMQLTGGPAAMRPTALRKVPAVVQNAGTQYAGSADIDNTNGTITFGIANSTVGVIGAQFDASGSKGLAAGFSITYPQ